MNFYYENNIGDSGYFSEDDLILAIFSAWNIEANLYLLDEETNQEKLIFAPYEDNEFNSDLLEEYGYKMIDGDEYREIIDVKTGDVVKYDWDDVLDLI